MRKPNFLIAGAPRSATTTLHFTLKKHPDIFMTNYKEPNYFCSGLGFKKWEDYLSLFKEAGEEKIVGESSVRCLEDESSFYKIKDKLGRVKVFFQLREPVSRALSGWRLRKRQVPSLGSFEKEIKWPEVDQNSRYIRFSLYAEGIKRAYDVFGKENVEVAIFEEFVECPEKIIDKILEFLKVEKISLGKVRKINAGGKPKLPFLYQITHNFFTSENWFKDFIRRSTTQRLRNRMVHQCEVLLRRFNLWEEKIKCDFNKKEKKTLQDRIFREDIEKLEKLLEKDLSFWKR